MPGTPLCAMDNARANPPPASRGSPRGPPGKTAWLDGMRGRRRPDWPGGTRPRFRSGSPRSRMAGGDSRPDSSFVEEDGGRQSHRMARTDLGRRQRVVGQQFWAHADGVSTVGRDEASIREDYSRATGRGAAPRFPDQVPRGAATSGGARSAHGFERFTLFNPPVLPGS